MLDIEYDDDGHVFIGGEFDIDELRKWILVKSPKQEMLEGVKDDGE